MFEVFKMIHGIDKVNLGKIFCIDEDGRTTIETEKNIGKLPTTKVIGPIKVL